MTIEVWHDRFTNTWVVQRKDNEGNQIDKVDYVHSKKEALDYANTYKTENQNSVIKVYKRSGDFHYEA